MLGLDPELLAILACPAPDHGQLRPGTPEDADASTLTGKHLKEYIAG